MRWAWDLDVLVCQQAQSPWGMLQRRGLGDRERRPSDRIDSRWPDESECIARRVLLTYFASSVSLELTNGRQKSDIQASRLASVDVKFKQCACSIQHQRAIVAALAAPFLQRKINVMSVMRMSRRDVGQRVTLDVGWHQMVHVSFVEQVELHESG